MAGFTRFRYRANLIASMMNLGETGAGGQFPITQRKEP